MSSAARTSVVVVHWNPPDLLLRCLEGLREPRERGRVDVLVIDNCSREDGFPDIGELPGLRIVRNPGNHGFARAANQGADWARGEFLLLLTPTRRSLVKSWQRWRRRWTLTPDWPPSHPAPWVPAAR